MDELEVRQALRQAVEAAGSQAAFADQLDVRPQFISAILRGKASPSRRILTALGIEQTYRTITKKGKQR